MQSSYWLHRLVQALPLVCAIFIEPATWADDQRQHFLEISTENDALTFNLDTVQLIAPSRFVISLTRIDNPDVMRLELRVLAAFKGYCTRPDGKYPAPADFLQLGAPDLPIEQIEVRSSETKAGGKTYPFKMVSWKYPYSRLSTSPGWGFLHCKQWGRSESDLYNESYASITNGIQSKELYDCKRALNGVLVNSDDPNKALMAPVRKETYGFEWYRAVCRAVTHEEPYLPPE